VRIAFLIAALNDLDVMACDVGNATDVILNLLSVAPNDGQQGSGRNLVSTPSRTRERAEADGFVALICGQANGCRPIRAGI
jgi:hypothetical protein